MHCSSRHRTPLPVLVAALPDAAPRPPAPGDRVGDADRERSAALLGDAVATGYLALDELDARLTRVWSASTRADLAAAEAGLPEALRRERARREAVQRARALARAGLRGHVASYASVMALLVGIWLVVGVTAGSWYPWPVWPALGWGIGLAGHARSAGGPGARHAASGPGTPR